MTNEIETWLLILTLIFPRLGLIIAYLGGNIPHNTIPLLGDIVLCVFVPRLLMTLYIASNMGTNNGWFWLHLIGFFVALLYNIGSTADVIKKGKNPWDPKSYFPYS